MQYEKGFIMEYLSQPKLRIRRDECREVESVHGETFDS